MKYTGWCQNDFNVHGHDLRHARRDLRRPEFRVAPPRRPRLQPEIHRVGAESRSTLRLL
jgi:hypothetical protein